jgi:hypothetical protein
MTSTNYVGTFIQVAEDCPVGAAEAPPTGAKVPTVATLQYDLITDRPYELTSDDVLFAVHAIRQNISEPEYEAARVAFFAKDQACLRSSPLGKRYGWGIHHDADGKVALVPLGSEQYQALAADPAVRQLRAMRSKRA